MGLCLIYGVTLTFSLLKTHKIKYIIFRSSCKKGCSLSTALPAGWGRSVGSERAPSPHTWQEPDVLSRSAACSKSLAQTKESFLMSWWMSFCWCEFWMPAGKMVVIKKKKEKKNQSKNPVMRHKGSQDRRKMKYLKVGWGMSGDVSLYVQQWGFRSTSWNGLNEFPNVPASFIGSSLALTPFRFCDNQ